MMGWFPFVLLTLGVLGAVVAIVIGRLRDKKRTETLTQMASELGLIFTPQGDAELQQRMSDFELFSRGSSRRLTNLMVGETDDVRLAIFDYKYTVSSGQNSSTYRQSVAAIESPGLMVPEFAMRPERFIDNLGGLLGFQDIDFEEHPEFSNAFVLKSKQEDDVRLFFSVPILDYFVGQGGVCVEAAAGRMIFYRANQRVAPGQLKELLATAYEIYGLFTDRARELKTAGSWPRANSPDDAPESQ